MIKIEIYLEEQMDGTVKCTFYPQKVAQVAPSEKEVCALKELEGRVFAKVVKPKKAKR